jgi:hypothetical protein
MIDRRVRHRNLRGAGKFIDNAEIVAEAREAPAGTR